jgi:hypothetical protein
MRQINLSPVIRKKILNWSELSLAHTKATKAIYLADRRKCSDTHQKAGKPLDQAGCAVDRTCRVVRANRHSKFILNDV